MFADHTLTPKEATRLCALGTLALAPMSYADLAVSIRHFISRVTGPTPEIMGDSIELLKYEGLAETVDGQGDRAILRLTADGYMALRELLTANLRPSSQGVNKLVVALKFRFMHLLDRREQLAQADLLLDVTERELARLEDLRRHDGAGTGYLFAWLDHDIDMLAARSAWLADFRGRLAAGEHQAADQAH
jgi:DNA-binding PadR family transcriptional regulator